MKGNYRKIIKYLKNQAYNGGSSLKKGRGFETLFHQHFIPSAQIEAEPAFWGTFNCCLRHLALPNSELTSLRMKINEIY